MRARERSPWRESVQGERDCTGGREFESETRESRRVDVTNAGFEIRVKPRIREEHRRGREFRVVLIQEREDRVK